MKRCAVPVAIVILAAAAHARAQPPSREAAAAQALFYRARALMQQGRYGEACPKLEESLRLDAGIGTQFNLADCNEHIGKTATAWAGFVEVMTAAKAAHQTERENVARRRAKALEPRLAKLVVEVSSPPGALEVARDGVAIARSTYGVEVPVDPGVHRITASAPHKQTWETSVHTVEAKTAHVTVPRDLPAVVGEEPLAATAPPPPVASDAATTETTETTAPTAPTEATSAFPPPVVESSFSAQRVAGWALAGAGAISTSVGIGFGLASIGDRNESRSHCVGDLCDADGVRMRDDAIRHGNIATITVLAGAGAVAGGLLLVLTAPRGVESPERTGALQTVRAVPSVAREGGGLLLEGVFH